MMAKVKVKSFRLSEEKDKQLGIVSVVIGKPHQELLREAVDEIIKKYQPEVQRQLSIQQAG
jgi:predicted DNA-binding protein